MEYIAIFISKNASFFNSYGNWLMIPLFTIVIITDRLLSKTTFTSRLTKWALRTPLFIISVVLGALIFMTNFPLNPMVSAIAKVQKNIGQKVYDFDFIDVRKDSTYKI